MNLQTTKTQSSALLLLGLSIMIIIGCGKEPNGNGTDPTGNINFRFGFYAEGLPLLTDTLIYVNEAGNQYLVNEIQFFISDITLHKSDGGLILIDAWQDVHYVDSDIPPTWDWIVYDDIAAGQYDAISFTFGINEQKNQSLMYVDPPESLMFWPEYLGGGYHYLKLNGKWVDESSDLLPFNFHLGIGQIYDNEGIVTGFIQNSFDITLQNSSFTLDDGETKAIDLVMEVDNWFRTPHTYDHNTWGGDIMQKQEAMALGCENGHDVFSVEGFVTINTNAQ